MAHSVVVTTLSQQLASSSSGIESEQPEQVAKFINIADTPNGGQQRKAIAPAHSVDDSNSSVQIAEETQVGRCDIGTLLSPSVYLQQATRAEDISGHQRRTKKLVAICRLWRSKTEMQMNQELGGLQQVVAAAAASGSATACRQHSTSDGSRPNQRAARERRTTSSNASRVLMTPGAAGMAFVDVTGGALVHNLESQAIAKKLWQSVVIPFVLGCSIFLVAVWTHQISMVLVKETIMTLVLLGFAFIIMTTFAFWLAQSQSVSPTCTNGAPPTSESHQHYHHFRHLSPPVLWSNVPLADPPVHECADARSNGRASCCSIAIIDCQPPEYHSALENSYPVSLLDSQPCLEKKSDSRDEYTKEESLALQHLSELHSRSPPPPTYDDWATASNDGNRKVNE